MTRVTYVIIFSFLCCACFFGQESTLPRHIVESGYPFYKNYTPDIYGQDPYNNSIVQDDNGLIYVGNKGLLIYDGTSWDFLTLPNKSRVIAMSKDDQGRIYVGGNGELGYLDSDSNGNIVYVSLMDKVDPKYRDQLTIWQIHATSKGVFFNGLDVLFRWKNNKFTTWLTKDSQSLRMAYVHDKLYVQVLNSDEGLHVFEKDELRPIKNGNSFNKDPIRFILPFDDNKLLIGTNSKNLEIYDNGRIDAFVTEVDDFLSTNIMSRAIRLTNGEFAIGTLSDGIVIIDRLGRQLKKIDDTALPSSMVINMFQDNTGLLWIATTFGIAKFDYPKSPYTSFGVELNIKGWAQKVTRFNNQMYIGTEAGLFYQNNVNSSSFFSKVDNSQFRIHDVSVFRDQLLVAGERGIYKLEGKKLILLHKCRPLTINQSIVDNSRVFIGTANGLITMNYESGNWKTRRPIEEVKKEVYTVIEMDNGDLWLGSNFSEVCKVSFSSLDDAIDFNSPIVERFNTQNGHPDDVLYHYKIENEIYFAAKYNRNVYRFDQKKQKFYLDNSLAQKFKMFDENIFIEGVDTRGSVLFSTKNNTKDPVQYLAIHQMDSSYKIKLLEKEHKATALLFYDYEDKIAWFAGNKGNFRLDVNIDRKNKMPFKTVIRNVTFKADSIIFGGYNKTNMNTSVPALPYRDNRFRFKYSIPSFYNELANTFQYKLEGFDHQWSVFLNESQKEYTNLPEGNYIFRVRGKDAFGQIGLEDQYSFNILAPWYQTWWAYLMYVFFTTFAIWLLVQWRSEQLTRKNLELESMINIRTREVNDKNAQLESQRDRLKELDTLKTRLFANISHEFRTPLTLIKGPIDELDISGENTLETSNIKMIRRNANRLLKLVNQLLDLSKLDSGKLKLNTTEGDIFKCIKSAASSFSSHAAQRGMDYQIKVPSKFLWVSFDRDKLEKIVYNLLSNAFKFTEDNETIKLSAKYENNHLTIGVRDFGKGIPQEKLSNIFNRFYQVDDSYTKEKEGTGIGLALTKELVELMNGEIYVESELGKGSNFKVVLPVEEIKSNKDKEEGILETDFLNADHNTLEIINDTKLNDSEKVLIVEDNADMRYFIKEQLYKDYEIIEAINGKEGLEKAIQYIPDLIITDVMMPKIDGITLCKKLKSGMITSHIPVIMLTAKAGIENRIEGLEMGADDYLTKPFNAREIKIRVKNLIEERKKLRKLFNKKIEINPSEVTVNSVDKEFIDSVLQLLEDQFDNPDFGVPEMQKELAVSKTQLHRKLKSLTDQPPGELLRNFRLKRAAQLLSQNGHNISEIAYMVGFNSLSYFTTCFKELYGVSPTSYKENPKDL